MIKGHVGMVKRFSKKYGNNGRSFNYLQAKANMASTVRIQVFSIMYYAQLRMEWIILANVDYPHEDGKTWKSTTIAV